MSTELVATIPGSKSLTNRALFAAAAAGGASLIRRPLISDDTLAFARCLRALGYAVDDRDPHTWRVTSPGGGPAAARAELDCQDAGTAARFLPALAACGRGSFRFDGSDQLRRRPLGPLLNVLRALGARIDPVGATRDLPFEMRADGLAGGEIHMDAGLSSQYLSALLLSAPLMDKPLVTRVRALVSSPYIDMTIGLMRRFGVGVDRRPDGTLAVRPGSYRAADIDIEPDASTASYFFAAAVLTGQTVTVPGLGSGSGQGDLRFVDVLSTMGADVEISATHTTVAGPARIRGGFSVDMGDISDTFMTLACLAPFADGPVHIHGIAHARLKESDRVEVVARNLTSCGVAVETGPDWMRIHPSRPSGALVACHRDHRIAMSFSVLGLRTPGVELDDEACVSKTFPGFHDEFARLFGDRRERSARV
ncbi:3-phosphoshikimate 1-carboxyvinyltransferase [Nonomuraea jabiensis]|uniref:3-phosphoshikimate 1-carboxyvinyltransferase n=1 Tax=Nonomuraea jabiensis TaxID=882448 RepID=A0A7W9L8X1_9ACTN|nr:3-phosphoshikimate 1-carboxyvinyltransferase [Nonomuraea jabiensis]MBB5774974.1 3-phosphoshikimate 1-carboxyvinyltransferase [Nonomuraea jabiensis]